MCRPDTCGGGWQRRKKNQVSRFGTDQTKLTMERRIHRLLACAGLLAWMFAQLTSTGVAASAAEAQVCLPLRLQLSQSCRCAARRSWTNCCLR